MKVVINILRYTVGLLFIFSGLIKANDPLGLSYKMLEFFEAWGWHFLDGFTLYASIAMNVCEVLAGVALIIGWQIKIFNWFLLLLISFFTFLTAYVLFSGKIKECGCFGDCIPLSGINTFVKDVVLLIMILILFFNVKYFIRSLTNYASIVFLLVTVSFTIGIQIYALRHLPYVDCLPYKKGNNILTQMQVPKDALPDSFAITFRYKKNGKIVEFDKNNFPNDFDSTYEYVDRVDKLIRKGNAEPAIVDFSLHTLSGNDTTAEILNEKAILVMLKDFDTPLRLWKDDVIKMDSICKLNHLSFYIVTALPEKASELFSAHNITILKADATVIKTAARVQPTYILLNKSTILGKHSFADLDLVEQDMSVLLTK